MNGKIVKPKAGDKYILRVVSDHDDNDGWVAYGANGLRFVSTDALGSMTPYDEDIAFQDGQRDVWETVRKAVLLRKDGGLFSGPEEAAAALGDSLYGFLAHKDYDAFKAALDMAEMCSIGDEVICDAGNGDKCRGVIVNRKRDLISILLSDGRLYTYNTDSIGATVHKTGKVYRDIERFVCGE